MNRSQKVERNPINFHWLLKQLLPAAKRIKPHKYINTSYWNYIIEIGLLKNGQLGQLGFFYKVFKNLHTTLNFKATIIKMFFYLLAEILSTPTNTRYLW